jgi:ubiquinone/menaquinone biosynthesis C-methylase UbiE
MTVSYWNKKHAEVYSKAHWAHKPSMFAEQAVAYFPKGGTVLEIGAGQSGDAAFFHSLGFAVTATDYSDEAVQSGKERLPDIVFLNVDTAEGLPFEDESFDVVYSHMALHYFDAETTKKVFADIHRILKPGGIFATIVNTMNNPEKERYHYVEIEPEYYHDPQGLKRRYFTVDSMRAFTEGLFTPLLLDAQGQTYKDPEPNLIRFIGSKIEL